VHRFAGGEFLSTSRRQGAKTMEINREPAPIARVVDWSLRGKAGEMLPEAVGVTFGI
jgi:NAD-dependent SIR2 family protein deacetylase